MNGTYSSIKLLSLEGVDTAAAWEKIWQGIKGDCFPKDFGGTPQFSSRPLRTITEQLSNLGVGSLAVGYPCLDDDFLCEYTKTIRSSHVDSGRSCVRLHFFHKDAKLSQETLEDDIFRLSTTESLPEYYLGFIVIRPTGNHCVGRTVIRHMPPSSKKNGPFIHVASDYFSNFLGSKLVVRGTPFMQQDQFNHACAGAALWSALYDLHRRYHTRRVYSTELIEIATKYSALGSNKGLEPQQVRLVLKEIGCSDHFRAWDFQSVKYQLKSGTQLRNIAIRDIVDRIYAYVQSNIPVLVGYWSPTNKQGRGHMVNIIGHDMQEEIAPEIAESVAGDRNSDYVSRLYCHDDQRGPYTSLRVWPRKSGESRKDEVVLADCYKIGIFPCVTNHVDLTYSDARKIVSDVLSWLSRKLIESGEDITGEDIRYLKENSRKRIYLQQTNRFRAQLFKSNGRNLNRPFREAYLKLNLPKYLYVCDICEKERQEDGRSALIGEILVDATIPPYLRSSSTFISIRLEDQLFIRTGSQIQYIEDPEYSECETPIAPLNRGGY